MSERKEIVCTYRGVKYIVKINNHVFFSSVGDADAAIS